MAFDLKAFQKTQFVPRETEITLDGLAEAGFGDGIVKVRGLTARELAEAEESASKGGKLLTDLVERLAGSGKDKVAALMDGIGFHQDVPAALSKRLEHVRLATVEPNWSWRTW